MINLSFNPAFSTSHTQLKKEALKTNIKLNAPLSKDTVSFTGINSGVVSDMKYKNVLGEQLVSEQSPTFEKDLQKVKGITSYEAAKTRISSISRYLKEDMVGFVVPEYTTKNENKGGYQWFEQGAEYLLRGCKKNAQPSDFKPIAKELYGLLAVHDNYWKSPEFVDYLTTLKPTPAIKATISAVEELSKPKDLSFTGEKTIKMFGYFSPMKAMDKLLKDGCAYSGLSLQLDDPTTKHGKIPAEVNASLEHIMPKSWGGPCDDANYMLASQKSNSLRGNMGLMQYLKGASDETFQ